MEKIMEKMKGEGVSGVACRTAWVVEELVGRGMKRRVGWGVKWGLTQRAAQ